MIKKIVIFLTVMVALIAGAELIARFVFGFGSPLLFELSGDREYRVKPNQNILRWGNHIMVNEQGLRNGPITLAPRKDSLRILCIGDSLTHGGEKIDQAETYPYKLEIELSALGVPCEVLNAASPGWSITNEANYIKKYGLYGSEVLVLLINDRDILEEWGNGLDPSYRNEIIEKRPVLALGEVLNLVRLNIQNILTGIRAKIFSKTANKKEMSEAEEMKIDAIRRGFIPADSKEDRADQLRTILWNGRINSCNAEIAALKSMPEYARGHGAGAIVVFLDTPMPARYEPGGEKYMVEMYKKAVMESGGVFIDVTGAIEKAGYKKLFRDNIHLNEQGNKVLAEVIAKEIKDYLKK